MDYINQLTELINSEIKKQYKSDRKFATKMNIPATTLSSILKNGVKGTAYSTVMDICMALGIKIIYSDHPISLDKDTFKFLYEYNKLDDIGKKVVMGAINREKFRMENDEERRELIKLAQNSNTEPEDQKITYTCEEL